jgi:Uncharacterized protein conserved in bacteria
MSIIPMLLQEFESEVQITRKMLGRVPDDRFNWQPHPKSMTLQRLVTHVAEIPSWVKLALTTDELDFADPKNEPALVNNKQELMDFFERSVEAGRNALAKATEDDLRPNWTMRVGEKIVNVRTKGEVIRMSLSQIIHHRAQLGVYLRLLDIPIPGSYGPSADEMGS